MRATLIAVTCVLVSVIAWLALHSRRLPERALASIESVEHESSAHAGPDEPVLAEANRSAANERARASTTDESVTTFHVIDGRSGADVERFELRITSTDEPPRAPRYERHAGGIARVLHAPRAEFTVMAPGFATLRSNIEASASSTAPRTIRLDRAGGIEGHVTLDGRPAAGARVLCLRDDAASGSNLNGRHYALQVREFRGTWSPAETDDAGHFVVSGVAPGRYALRIEADGAAFVLLRGIAVPDDRSVDVGTVALERECVVRGTIIPPVDEAPSSIRIFLDQVTPPEPPPANFDFEFRGLTAGVHEMDWQRKDGGGTQNPASHRMTLELKAGEVREVVVDATGNSTSRLRLSVRSNGLPAAQRFVRATTDLEGRDPFGGWTVQSTTDADGRATLLLAPKTRVRIEVFGPSMQWLGSSAETIELAEGEERSLTLDFALGTVVLMLPPSLHTPSSGRIQLTLESDRAHPIVVAANTAERYDPTTTQPFWRTNQVDLGQFPAGKFTAKVSIERLAATAVNVRVPEHLKWESLRPPFETPIEVLPGRETVIAVPE